MSHPNLNNPYATKTTGASSYKSHTIGNSNTADQFNSLNSEKQVWQNQEKKADQQRALIEQRINELRAEKAALQEKIRVTQDMVSRHQSEKTSLTAEFDYYANKKKVEGRELDECAKKVNAGVEDEFNKKREFARHMEDVNGKVAEINAQVKDRKLRSMISVETVPMLVEAMQQRQQQQQHDGGSGSAAAAMENLTAAWGDLTAATDDFKDTVKKGESLQKQIKSLRERVVQISKAKPDGKGNTQQQRLEEADLIELEARWQQAPPMEHVDGENRAPGSGGGNNGKTTKNGQTLADPAHLQLFYGSGNEHATGDDAVPTTTDGEDGVGHASEDGRCAAS